MSLNEFEFRPITKAELSDFLALERYVFADNSTPSQKEIDENPLQPEMTTCAFYKGKLVASGGGYPFVMRLNGNGVAVDGVTSIGTDPGFRRRGLVRRIVTDRLAQAYEAGQVASILWASQGAIYQRFGYGLGSFQYRYAFDPIHAELSDESGSSGQVTRIPHERAKKLIPDLYRKFIDDRNLMLHRHPVAWEVDHFKSKSKHFAVHLDANDEPDGYVSYHTNEAHNERETRRGQRLGVSDFVYFNNQAFSDLWSYVRSHDLVWDVTMTVSPDFPAQYQLLEPRILQAKWNDGIWLRVVNVREFAVSRNYSQPAEVSFEIREDSECPWNAGRFRLSTSETEAEIQDHRGECDFSITIPALACLLSGNVSLSNLQRIGRAELKDPRRAPQLDSLFATKYAPYCHDFF